MKISEIRQALVGKILCIDGIIIMSVVDCKRCGKRVKLEGRLKVKTDYISLKCAEALATDGIYQWHDGYLHIGDHQMIAVKPLRLTEDEQ